MVETRYFLRGKKVALRPVESADFALFYQWFNDPTVTRFMFVGQKPKTMEQIQREIEAAISNEQNAVFTVLAIDRRPCPPVVIGWFGLYGIHPTARKAELIGIIGDDSYRSGGYGSETEALLAWYGFDRLNLHRIYGGITSENTGAIKACERAGFVQEGVLREDIYRNGRYYDVVRMAILREDYYREVYPKVEGQFRCSPGVV